jgi:hypothetical protein
MKKLLSLFALFAMPLSATVAPDGTVTVKPGGTIYNRTGLYPMISYEYSGICDEKIDEVFTPFRKAFGENLHMYQIYLGNDSELTNLGKLHLMALRALIDTRLHDFNALEEDLSDIGNLVEDDAYLLEEYFRKYKIVKEN